MTPDTIPRSGCVVLSLLILISFTIILSHDTINSAYFQVSPLSIHKIIEEKFPRKFKMKVLYATDTNGKLERKTKTNCKAVWEKKEDSYELSR